MVTLAASSPVREPEPCEDGGGAGDEAAGAGACAADVAGAEGAGAGPSNKTDSERIDGEALVDDDRPSPRRPGRGCYIRSGRGSPISSNELFMKRRKISFRAILKVRRSESVS